MKGLDDESECPPRDLEVVLVLEYACRHEVVNNLHELHMTLSQSVGIQVLLEIQCLYLEQRLYIIRREQHTP